MSEILVDPRRILFIEKGWGEGTTFYRCGQACPHDSITGPPIEAIVPYREQIGDYGQIFFRIIVNGDVQERVPAQYCTITYEPVEALA